MIDHVWTVICADSSVDRDTNNVTMSRAFGNLNISMPKPPDDPNARGVVIPHRFQVVTCWARSDPATEAKGYGKLRFVDPSDETLIESSNYEVDLVEGTQTHARLVFETLPLTMEGRYRFRVFGSDAEDEKWREVGDAPLDVSIHWTESKKDVWSAGQMTYESIKRVE